MSARPPRAEDECSRCRRPANPPFPSACRPDGVRSAAKPVVTWVPNARAASSRDRGKLGSMPLPTPSVPEPDRPPPTRSKGHSADSPANAAMNSRAIVAASRCPSNRPGSLLETSISCRRRSSPAPGASDRFRLGWLPFVASVYRGQTFAMLPWRCRCCGGSDPGRRACDRLGDGNSGERSPSAPKGQSRSPVKRRRSCGRPLRTRPYVLGTTSRPAPQLRERRGTQAARIERRAPNYPTDARGRAPRIGTGAIGPGLWAT